MRLRHALFCSIFSSWRFASAVLINMTVSLRVVSPQTIPARHDAEVTARWRYDEVSADRRALSWRGDAPGEDVAREFNARGSRLTVEWKG